MRAWITEITNQFGYPGVARFIALESTFLPIPSEVILTSGGFTTTCTMLGAWGVIAAAIVDSVIGAIVPYGAGRFLKPDRLKKLLAGRLGWILRLDPDDIDGAIARFNRKGYTAALFCRFIPIIRGLISIPAGTAWMKMPSFLLLIALGSATQNTVLAWLGAVAGALWGRIMVYVDTYTTLVVVVILVVALLHGAWLIKKRFLAES